MTTPAPGRNHSGLESYRQQASDRSVLSVQIAIAELQARDTAVTLAAIVAMSRSLAESGHPGVAPVSHMTVLRNEGCRKLFDEATSANSRRRRKRRVRFSPAARMMASRLMRLTKKDLVIRIVGLEAKVDELEAQTAKLRSALLEASLGPDKLPPV